MSRRGKPAALAVPTKPADEVRVDGCGEGLGRPLVTGPNPASRCTLSHIATYHPSLPFLHTGTGSHAPHDRGGPDRGA